MRTSIRDLLAMKRRGERIAVVTAYDYPSAALADRAGLPAVLVGDSLGMVVHGHASTLPVSLDDMVRHTAAVVRGSLQALVIADLPFLSYATLEDAVQASRRLMGEAGAQAVKLEGVGAALPIVARLTELGVPVMGHLGYTPQSEHLIGARAQAKDAPAARQLLDDALALEAAGAFGIVLELIPAALARAVSQRLTIPTIGIGAGDGCDGQVQVWHDVLGLSPGKPPRHAKVYAEIGGAIVGALQAYAAEVRDGTFPTQAQSVTSHDAEIEAALAQPLKAPPA